MNTPLPLFHRLVILLEKLQRQPRGISMRSAASQDGAAATVPAPVAKPRKAAALLPVHGLKSHRLWLHKGRSHNDVTQTPSNLM